MKKILLMLTFCGALATLPAQVNTGSDPMKRTDKEDMQGHDMSKPVKKHVNEGNKSDYTGMTTPTYTHTPATSKDKTDVSIPEKIRNKFKTDYPGMMPKWSVNKEYYVASYKHKYKEGKATDKVESVVVYDNDAKLVRTEAEVKYKDYPVAIVTYYEKNFPNGAVYKVWEVDNKRDGTKKYYTVYNGQTRWFDWEGKEMMDHQDWHHDWHDDMMPKPNYK